jgi:CHAT domain-containing protein
LEHLLNRLKEAKPTWFQYKYRTIDDELIRQVQDNLSNHEVLLEYFYSDSVLYSFCLSKGGLRHHEEPLPYGLETYVNTMLSFVAQPKIYIGDSVAYMNYREAGWELYKLLINPYEKEIKGKSLVVIPFEKLTYIPFETLLTHESLSQPYNFKELPYLIKQHQVRYLYASNLLNIKKAPNPDRNMVAFAPEYKGKNQSQQNRGSSSFNSLEKTNDEVKSVAGYFPGKLYRSSEASEANFKKVAGDYSTLHLAMHATINDSSPMLSRLVFTPNSSKKEDDFLYTYEIPNLRLNADLVILSACNTGIGKLRKGEGMMSLTRSFAFAGVPSIMTTLWSVNDNSSSELMRNFYQSLSSGNTKDQALANAKLKYLGNSDVIHAHPYYWAGYVLIGDNNPIQKTSNVGFIMIFVLVAVVIVIGFWLIRRKNSVEIQTNQLLSGRKP